MASTDLIDQQNEKNRSIARQRTAWIVLAVLLLFSIAAPLNQFKVPPILPILSGLCILGLLCGWLAKTR